jgi:hypothetical protein
LSSRTTEDAEAAPPPKRFFTENLFVVHLLFIDPSDVEQNGKGCHNPFWRIQMNRRRRQFAVGGVIVMLLNFMPVTASAQMSKVKTVWVILMENHNWTGNNTGAAFGAPDIKGSPKAPYVNSVLANTAAFAEQYYNPPGNHPSQPNYLWLEAGTNFGVLADTQPGQPQLNTHQHFVTAGRRARCSFRVGD